MRTIKPYVGMDQNTNNEETLFRHFTTFFGATTLVIQLKENRSRDSKFLI